MGYLHINNLYKDQSIFMFRECYALEKIHGTSAHVAWNSESQEIKLFSGGEPMENFEQLFDLDELKAKFIEVFQAKDVVIFGEAYGGKQQGMRATYGNVLKFIVFDVKVNVMWLDVPVAHEVAESMGMEFVDYVRVPAELEALEAERDKPSTQAARNGVETKPKREGIVARPLLELRRNNGDRVIVKFKQENFRETKTKRPIDIEKLKVLEDAKAIAKEWVTEMRLQHVLDKLPEATSMASIREVIEAMVADVYREGKGELVEGPEVEKLIGGRTAHLFKDFLKRNGC